MIIITFNLFFIFSTNGSSIKKSPTKHFRTTTQTNLTKNYKQTHTKRSLTAKINLTAVLHRPRRAVDIFVVVSGEDAGNEFGSFGAKGND